MEIKNRYPVGTLVVRGRTDYLQLIKPGTVGIVCLSEEEESVRIWWGGVGHCFMSYTVFRPDQQLSADMDIIA